MPFWGFLGQTKMMRRCARERGVKEVQKSGGGVPYGVGIDDERRQSCGPPMRNQSGLAAQSAAERKGKWRGEGELYIGTGWGRNGRGNKSEMKRE
jgi:hypothetical protein